MHEGLSGALNQVEATIRRPQCPFLARGTQFIQSITSPVLRSFVPLYKYINLTLLYGVGPIFLQFDLDRSTGANGMLGYAPDPDVAEHYADV